MLADKRVHAVMPTHDVERLGAFYRDVLGIPVLAERPAAMVFETSPGSVFVVSRTGGLSSGAHTQMAFTVTDVEAEVADLRARGVEPESTRRRRPRTASRGCPPAAPPGSRTPTATSSACSSSTIRPEAPRLGERQPPVFRRSSAGRSARATGFCDAASRSRRTIWPSASSSPTITANRAPTLTADSSWRPSLRGTRSTRSRGLAAQVRRDPEPLRRRFRVRATTTASGVPPRVAPRPRARAAPGPAPARTRSPAWAGRPAARRGRRTARRRRAPTAGRRRPSARTRTRSECSSRGRGRAGSTMCSMPSASRWARSRRSGPRRRRTAGP